MLSHVYTYMINKAQSDYAPLWLALIAFSEASFFPLPPDLLLIPMILAQPKKAWQFATICTLASVTGGIFGWYIGAFLMDYLAQPIVHFYHAEATLLALQEKFRLYGVWFILIKGLTPIPYKLVSIASGAALFPIGTFVLASLATRGLRFFIIAALLYFFGASIQNFIEKRLTLVATIFAALMVIGIFAIKYV
ncbi:YqaA family protein [Entomobacter blattae]|uniref:Cytochrome B n=1 Tax=Entomobacter blattae TaxID=2762277 RepID=A0A7H1NQ04_9PROT|nr:DedA family protein [Entomobacter blattae]QNT77864.1 hypothetical protein JGUZn3_06220 [Entomobacter blattae]